MCCACARSWGGLGNHRYPIGFSGDTSPVLSLSLSLSCSSSSSLPLFAALSRSLDFDLYVSLEPSDGRVSACVSMDMVRMNE